MVCGCERKPAENQMPKGSWHQKQQRNRSPFCHPIYTGWLKAGLPVFCESPINRWPLFTRQSTSSGPICPVACIAQALCIALLVRERWIGQGRNTCWEAVLGLRGENKMTTATYNDNIMKHRTIPVVPLWAGQLLRYAFWLCVCILNFDIDMSELSPRICSQLYSALSSFCNTSPTAMGEEHFHGRMS